MFQETALRGSPRDKEHRPRKASRESKGVFKSEFRLGFGRTPIKDGSAEKLTFPAYTFLPFAFPTLNLVAVDPHFHWLRLA